MNWNDPEQVRAYKSGWQTGARLAKFIPRPGITELAYQCMLNEFERARRSDKRKLGRNRRKRSA